MRTRRARKTSPRKRKKGSPSALRNPKVSGTTSAASAVAVAVADAATGPRKARMPATRTQWARKPPKAKQNQSQRPSRRPPMPATAIPRKEPAAAAAGYAEAAAATGRKETGRASRRERVGQYV